MTPLPSTPPRIPGLADPRPATLARAGRRRTLRRVASLALGLALVLPPALARADISQIIDFTGDGTHWCIFPNFGSIAVDAFGNAFVTCSDSDNAFRIAPGGAITQIIDATGDGVHALDFPNGIAVDADGNAYVAGTSSKNVFKVTPGGVVTQIIDATGDGTHALEQPLDSAIDAAGNVYVSGGSSNNAFRITPEGVITEIIDATGDGTHALDLSGPIATDPAGNVYVTGYVSDNAFRIAPGGAVTQIIDATGDGVHPLTQALGVAADAAGNAYVSGFLSNNVFRITPGGTITEILDATGDGTHPFEHPTDLATDSAGNVYVSAAETNNAFRIAPDATITQIIDPSGDGTHPLFTPTGIAVSSFGYIYVAGLGSTNAYLVNLKPPGSCTLVPRFNCVTAFEKAQLVVDEKVAGKEKLQMKLGKGPTLSGSDLGNPLAPAGTAYSVCLYNDANALVAEYRVDRAGLACVSAACWKGFGKPAGVNGYQYKDKAASADGVLQLQLKAGKSAQAQVKGSNNAAKGMTALPVGMAAALGGSLAPTIQISGSDASVCLGVTLTTVSLDDGIRYRAKK